MFNEGRFSHCRESHFSLLLEMVMEGGYTLRGKYIKTKNLHKDIHLFI